MLWFIFLPYHFEKNALRIRSPTANSSAPNGFSYAQRSHFTVDLFGFYRALIAVKIFNGFRHRQLLSSSRTDSPRSRS